METYIPKDPFGRPLEGYRDGHLVVQADSVINFDEAFGPVLNHVDNSVRIPNPLASLTPREWERYREELRGVERAQNIGKLAAMGLRDRAEYLRKQPL